MQKRRSIKYCQLDLLNNGQKSRELSLFDKIVKNITSKADSDRNYDQSRTDKVINIQNIVFDGDYTFITFKSAKYGHVSTLLNRIDGSERLTDKTMDEGEKELTHVCFKKMRDCIIFSIESNKDGIYPSSVTNYLNKELHEINDNYDFSCSYLATEGFIDIINGAERVISVDVECRMCEMGDDIFTEMYGEGVKETCNLQFKSERSKSIPKSILKKICNSIKSDKKIHRVRAKIKTKTGDEVLFDTLMDKVTDSIQVNLDDNGVVISSEMNANLKECLIKLEKKIRCPSEVP